MEVFLIRLLQFLMAISLLVLLHECGHFFFAKLFHVRVRKFYLFFNPKFHLASTYDKWVRRWLKWKPVVVPSRTVTVTDKEKGKSQTEIEKKYVGTEYGLGWLPLGGYCAIDGMIDETNFNKSDDSVEIAYGEWQNDISAAEQAAIDARGEQLFCDKPVWQRFLIMIGGVLVNFVLALIIYSAVLYHWGETYVPLSQMTDGMKFNSEARQLGFEDGDILLSTDRGPLKKFDDDLFRQVSKARRVDVLRHGTPVSINIPETANLNLLNMFKATPMFMRPLLPAVVDSVLPMSAAASIGLQKGDSILALNGKPVGSYNEFTDEIARLGDVLATAKTAGDSLRVRSVELVVWRTAQAALATDSLPYAPDTMRTTLSEDLKLGFITLMKYQPTTFRHSLLGSIPAGIGYGWHKLSGYVSDMQYVFTSEGAKSLGGFGAIGSLFPEMWDWHRFWEMTAFLSIILAFMNILPIPALDGGHVLFLLWEMITRRKPSDNFIVNAEKVGIGILILLMVVANLNDILRWLGYM